MLIKQKDSIDKNLEQLETIEKLPYLTKDQLVKVEKEIKCLRSGNKGEEDSAYFIDFHWRDSQNWAIIHDLRLEHNGYVAQIDHLLISRFLDFFVLESKNYANGIKVTEQGEFLVWYQNRYISIESPIEQNQRHVKVLKDFLMAEDLLPKRLGITLSPNLSSYILVSPKSRVIRPKPSQFNTDIVVKADQFYKQLKQHLDNESLLSSIGSVAKMISSESLREFSQRLASYHKPIQVNYYSKFGISKVPPVAKVDEQPGISKVPPAAKVNEQKPPEPSPPQPETLAKNQPKYYCYTCKKSISDKVASFCFGNKDRFKGKAYCFDCQKLFQ